jgi:hypothetical protein
MYSRKVEELVAEQTEEPMRKLQKKADVSEKFQGQVARRIRSEPGANKEQPSEWWGDLFRERFRGVS